MRKKFDALKFVYFAIFVYKITANDDDDIRSQS